MMMGGLAQEKVGSKGIISPVLTMATMLRLSKAILILVLFMINIGHFRYGGMNPHLLLQIY